MARVLGKPGRYVEEQSVKKAQEFVFYLLIALVTVSGLLGFLAVKIYERNPVRMTVPVVGIMALTFVAKKRVDKRLNAIERDRINFRKGAVGEALIAGVLEGLSDDYVVIHDLTRRFGNLDHVVVGPTGVFIIDTKNWRGTVKSDDNRELLLNGKLTDKPVVKNLVRAMMDCRRQVIDLCDSRRLQNEFYVRAVLAFPITFVDVKWGTLKHVDCVTDEGLLEYIEKNKPNEKLSKDDIDSISDAFELLARMEKRFSDAGSTHSATP